MITKSVIKDYVHRRCPYFAKAALEDKTLLKLIEDYLEIEADGVKKIKERTVDLNVEDLYEDPLEDEEKEETGDNPEEDKTLDIIEIMKDYPHLQKEINELLLKYKKINPLYDLFEEYSDNQTCADLSRRYIELIYGKDVCRRCDIYKNGNPILDQKTIVNNTLEALNDPNVKVVFEGQIEKNDLRARFDALIKEDDGTFTLIEAKGSNTPFKIKSHTEDINTGIKIPYLYDLLFQYYLYDTVCHYPISKLGYLHLNKGFTFKDDNINYPNISDEDIKKLFKISYELNYQKSRSKADPVPVTIKDYFDNEMYLEVTKDGEPSNESIEDIIMDLRTIGAKFKIDPEKHYECVKGGKCPLLNSCFGDANDPDSIFKLTRWGDYAGSWNRSKKLMEDGVLHISEMPQNVIDEYKDDFVTTSGVHKYGNGRTQIRFQKEWKNEDFDYVIHMDMLNDLLHTDYLNDKIDYLVFFDFESIQNPVPLVKDAHPWQQVVTQYSMHILSKDYDLTKHDFAKGRGGGCSHYEFIGHPKKDGYKNPEFDLFKTLKEQLEECGVNPMGDNYRVVVFNQNFEKTRMDEFVRYYVSHPDVTPELIDFVNNFNNNVVDLLFFFTRGSFYGRNFNGRGSLKVVQPTLCEDEQVQEFYKNLGLPFDLAYSLDYHKEGALVYNGGICLDLYKSLLLRSHIAPDNNTPDEDEMLGQALAYCKIDSWGTVIIYDVIKNICEGKLKLKSLILK